MAVKSFSEKDTIVRGHENAVNFTRGEAAREDVCVKLLAHTMCAKYQELRPVEARYFFLFLLNT